MDEGLRLHLALTTVAERLAGVMEELASSSETVTCC